MPDAPDAPDAPVDALPDANGTFAASCNTLHAANPALPSGMYTIDPDGSGGDAPLSVTCDMTVEGGGWTIIFFPATINLTAAPTAYTTSTPRLLADATSALLAYRTAVLAATGSHAVFDIPADWKASPPFVAAAADVTLPVSIDGGAPTAATLRYGQQGFGNRCVDPWIAATTKGRICITDTTAPFFNGFVAPENDKCSDSLSYWYAANCTTDVRFSIAVR